MLQVKTEKVLIVNSFTGQPFEIKGPDLKMLLKSKRYPFLNCSINPNLFFLNLEETLNFVFDGF